MKITLVTSATTLEEVQRIKEEVSKAGHKFALTDFSDFHFLKKGEKLTIHPAIPESDLVIVRGLFSTMRSLESLKDYLMFEGVKIFDNNLFDHKYSMNKAYDILKLIFNEITVPDTFNAREYKDLYKVLDYFEFPLVVKSSRAGKGTRVWMFRKKEGFINFICGLEAREYPAKNIIVQEFIDYEYDVRVLVIGDKIYGMRRIPKAGDFRANFSLGGSVAEFGLTAGIRKLAQRAVDVIGLEIAGVDILIDKKGKAYILEVNHTPGMVGMEKATGENITKIHLDYAVNHAKKLQQ